MSAAGDSASIANPQHGIWLLNPKNLIPILVRILLLISIWLLEEIRLNF